MLLPSAVETTARAVTAQLDAEPEDSSPERPAPPAPASPTAPSEPLVESSIRAGRGRGRDVPALDSPAASETLANGVPPEGSAA